MSVSPFEFDLRHQTSQAALFALQEVAAEGVVSMGGIDDADKGIQIAERLRRFGAVAAVDSMQAIHKSGVYLDQGHVSARVMVAHRAGLSPAEAFQLDRIRRMVHGLADQIDFAWRAGELGVDQAAVLAKIYANPRVRDRFVAEQQWFIDQATALPFNRFKKRVATWAELADDDGATPAPDPSEERRNGSMAQDHFSKAWHLRAQFGSLRGARFHETLQAYVDAETALDWQAARAEHGPNATRDQLPRTDDQRFADALCQIGEDAVGNSAPSVRTKRVHNLVWKGETAEELMRRFFGIRPRAIAIDDYGVSDLDGNLIHAPSAIVDLVTDSFRRVVTNPASVTIDLSEDARFYTGLTRLGVELQADECYWPGCHKPTTRCQIDHLKPAARGGPSTQVNGLPACVRHNLVKEAGYTVTRLPDGTIQIITPTGDVVR